MLTEKNVCNVLQQILPMKH